MAYEILSNVPEAVIGGIYDIKEEKERRSESEGVFCIMKQKKPCWQIRTSMWF